MIKLIKRLNKYARIAIEALVRIILIVLYFTLFLPLGIIIRIFTDFLEIKKKDFSWVPHYKIENIKEFLIHQ